MGIGIGRFLPWENGVQTTLELGFGHWEWKKNMLKNQKWEWDSRIAKWNLEKKELGNGIGTPFRTFLLRSSLLFLAKFLSCSFELKTVFSLSNLAKVSIVSS